MDTKIKHFMVHSSIAALRACLHGGGGPQVGEVTCLGGVKKHPSFTCNLTTPPSRGALFQGYWMVAKHVNKKKCRQITCFGDLMHFYTHLMLLLQPSVQWRSIVNFNNDAKPLPKWILREFDVPLIRPGQAGYPTLKRLHGKIWPRLRG